MYLSRINKLFRQKIHLIIILIFIICIFNGKNFLSNFFDDILINKRFNCKNIDLSIVVNFHNLTKDKHTLFYKVMKKYNISRIFYFIFSQEKSLNPNINSLIENSSVKVVQSNFPDSFYLQLVLSLYGKNSPEYILYIEGDDIIFH